MSRLERDEDEIEASRAPLMDHLIELRGRLVICVVAFVLGFILCFAFSEPLYIFLVKPFAAAAAFHSAVGPGGHVSPLDLILGTAGLKALPVVDGQMVNLIYTAPLEILFTKMKLAGFGATKRYSCQARMGKVTTIAPKPASFILVNRISRGAV